MYDYNTISELIRVINFDSLQNNTCIKAYSEYPEQDVSVFINGYAHQDVYLENGKDGLSPTKNDLFLALDIAYDLLIGFQANMIVPLEAYFDDFDPAIFNDSNYYGSYTYSKNKDYLRLVDTENQDKFVTFHGQLIEFCKNQINAGVMSHGVLSFGFVNSLSDLEKDNYILDWVQSTCIQSRYDLTYYTPSGYVDDGQYISITLGDFTYNKSTPDEYRFAWNAMYAAIAMNMTYSDTTTNQNIITSAVNTYDLVNDEIPYLSDYGIIAPRLSVRKGLVVSNGVTPAISTSSLHYLVNVRQIQVVMNELNQAVQFYKGEAIQPLMNNNQIQKIIDSTLTELKNQGLVIDYRFNLEYDKNSSSGLIKVDLLTKNMVEYVSTQAQLSLT